VFLIAAEPERLRVEEVFYFSEAIFLYMVIAGSYGVLEFKKVHVT
jgi:hypothetical protein